MLENFISNIHFDQLADEAGGIVTPDEIFKNKIRDFVRRLAQKFSDNNDIIASNPTHPKASVLRKENRTLTTLMNKWEKVLKT